MTDIKEDDGTAFVIHVPQPSSGDTTIESCLRLGTSTLPDETTTYQHAASEAQGLTGLSWETYHLTSGIALVTPGTINLVAAQGVNMTSGSSFTNSTTGSSYTVTQEPHAGHIISASYTDKEAFGLWTTSSYNQASTVSVNTTLLQASLGLGLFCTVSGPLTCSNTWGGTWSSVAGLSVTGTLAKVVNVGAHTIVSNAFSGSNNEYYTADQASSTAAGFKFMVPVTGKYATFDTAQQLYCGLVEALALATSVAATVYAAAIAGKEDGGSPSDVQSWLKEAQLMAGICTTANGVLCAAGLVLGLLVDLQAGDPDLPAINPNNVGATWLKIGDGNAVLRTGSDKQAPALNLEASGTKQITLSTDDPATGTMLRLDGKTGVTLGKTGKALITMTDSSLVLQFGNSASVTLDATGIVLNAGSQSVTVKSDGVTIAGQSVTIEAVMLQMNSLLIEIKSGLAGLVSANQMAAALAMLAAEAQRLAAEAAAQVAAALRLAEAVARAARAAAATVPIAPTPRP
jgi:hypothetical protein